MGNERDPRGINDLSDAFMFAAGLGSLLGKSLEDKSVSMTEVFQMLTFVALNFNEVFDGYQNIIPEALDLDDAEITELRQLAEEEFDIPQDESEVFVEDSVKLALYLLQFVSKHFVNQ